MTSYRIKRDDNRDLSFEGERLGEGSHGTGGTSGYECDWNRRTDVTIYKTATGRYVVSVHQSSRWLGERTLYRAWICERADGVLPSLIEDCGGDLGIASKEAFEEACGADAELALHEVEAV